MAATIHILGQHRLIDTDGIDDGGTIFFYLSGSTTLAPIYSDANLTSPMANPVEVAAGANVPTIYLDSTVSYRRVIEYSDGSSYDVDPYIPIGTVGGGGGSASYSTIAALAEVSPGTSGELAFVVDPSRKGMFIYNADDLSTEVSLDNYQGYYVAPSSDPTGSSGAWVRQVDTYVTADMFGWTESSTPEETQAFIQAALDLASRENLGYKDTSAKTIRGTILIPTASVILCTDEQLWTFKTDNVSNDYTQVLQRSGGTGVYVAVDTKIGRESKYIGSFDLRAEGTDGTNISQFDSVTRARIAANLAAFCPSDGEDGNGTECIIDKIYMQGFGYGFYQGAWNGAGSNSKALGFTRTSIQFAHFLCCLVPFTSGLAGNGFDDMVINVMRIARSGNCFIKNTELTINSLYWAGLVFNKGGTDAEAQTITGTAGSNVVTVSDAGHNIVEGSYIGLADSAHNKLNDPMGCVYEVTNVSGTSVTLHDNLQEDVTDIEFGLDPSYLSVTNGGKLNCGHIYLEHCIRNIVVNAASYFITEDLKLGGGDTLFFGGVPVWTVGLSSNIDITMHPVGENNQNCLSIVGFVPLSRLGEEAQANIRVKSAKGRAEGTTRSDLVTCVAPPGFVSLGFHDDESAEVYFKDPNIEAVFGDATYRLRCIGRVTDTSGSNEGTVMYRVGKEIIQGKSAAGSGVAVVILEDNEMPAVYSQVEVDLVTTNGTQAGKVTIFRQTGNPVIAGRSELGGNWSINGSNQLIWTPSVAGTQNFLIRKERVA